MAKKTQTEDLLYSDFAYDDAFRTMETECNDLLLPFLNYAFNENYDNTAVITRFRNEHFIEHEDHTEEKKITDSHFEVMQNGIAKRYHLECESKPYDKSILIRIFEYDAQIAVDDAVTDRQKIKLRFPHSGLLMLRSNSGTPDDAEVVIETPQDSISYRIPIIKVSDFTIEELFEKRLFMLIPFYIFNYEKDLPDINGDSEKLIELTEFYRRIMGKLDELQAEGELSSFACGVIISLTHKVLYKLTMKQEAVQQKVGDIMGGKVLDLPIIRVYHDGLAEGEAKGEAKGEAERAKLQEENDSLKKEIERLKASMS